MGTLDWSKLNTVFFCIFMRNLAKLKLAPSSVWRVAQRFKHRNFDADKVEQNRFERTRAKVLEIENVVQIIRNEGALDLCVIRVPEERKYVEHFIICTPRNDSQLVSIPGNLAEHYREITGKRKYIEGLGTEESPPNWTVIDLGNIVVHTMNADVREKFDLETLWVLGTDFDGHNQVYSDEDQEQILGIVTEETKQKKKDWAFFD